MAWVIPEQFLWWAGHIVPLGGHCHWGMLLPGGCLRSLHQCLGGGAYQVASTCMPGPKVSQQKIAML